MRSDAMAFVLSSLHSAAAAQMHHERTGEAAGWKLASSGKQVKDVAGEFIYTTESIKQGGKRLKEITKI